MAHYFQKDIAVSLELDFMYKLLFILICMNVTMTKLYVCTYILNRVPLWISLLIFLYRRKWP
jgi:hypothetical protein